MNPLPKGVQEAVGFAMWRKSPIAITLAAIVVIGWLAQSFFPMVTEIEEKRSRPVNEDELIGDDENE